MKSTLTSKGQITIPIGVRTRLHLKPGDILEFDEEAPFLKATKTIPPQAWAAFAKDWIDPLPELDASTALTALRGPVDLPPAPRKP